jgi:hypothetical protein
MSGSGIAVGLLALGLVAVACEAAESRFTVPERSGVELDAGKMASRWAGWPSLDACILGTGRTVFRDFDGDGVIGTWVVGCGREEQKGLLVSNSDDCDDTDPTRAVKGFRDADGDGYTLQDAECFASRPAEYRPLRSTIEDCDDSSAERQRIMWRDADGDAYGDKASPLCARGPGADGSFPLGLADNPDDCNDGDSAVHPIAEEHWDDGVDSNCDGSDSPLDCDTNRAKCGCELLRTSGVPILSSCVTADLFFADQVACRECSGYSALIIGNQGSTPVVGNVDPVGSDGQRIHVEGNLGPGAVSYPAVVRAGAASVHIESAAVQCDTTNDDRTLEDTTSHCVL